MDNDPLLIGAHTSAAGGPHNALLEGQRIGATTIQLFTSNQKQWKGRELTSELLDSWHKALDETGLKEIMSHASYLINLGSPDPVMVEKSIAAFEQEIIRCQTLGLAYLNFHPGAAKESSAQECIEQIIKSLLTYAKLLEKGPTRLLLETTAGQGTTVGHEFAHLGQIIHAVKDELPIGVCIDTCHIFAAGYDIRNKEAWDQTLEAFDQDVGLEHLYAFHVNDSAKPFGSRRDRHACLGEGDIGIDCFEYMMTHPKMRKLPKYLETPKGTEVWKEEIALLRKFGS